MWKNKVTEVYIVPVVIGALEMFLKNISRYLEITEFDRLEKLQKACFLGAARILRKFLNAMIKHNMVIRVGYKK